MAVMTNGLWVTPSPIAEFAWVTTSRKFEPGLLRRISLNLFLRQCDKIVGGHFEPLACWFCLQFQLIDW